MQAASSPSLLYYYVCGWNVPNQSQPNTTVRPDGPPCSVDGLPERVGDVLDGGVGPDDAVVLGQHLQPQQPARALPPQLGHLGRFWREFQILISSAGSGVAARSPS